MSSNKKNDTGTEIRTCDVHYYALKDATPRECYYCSLCDAWICQDCDPNIPLRAIATLRKAKAKLFGESGKLKKTA